MQGKFVKILVCALLSALVMLSVVVPASAATASDAYNYDSWGNAIDVPSGFEVETSIGYELSTPLNNPRDMHYQNDTLYVLDSGNSRVVMYDKDYNYKGELKEFYTMENGVKTAVTLNQPQGLFVTLDGRYFIADTANYRVIMCNANGEVTRILTKPETENFPSELEFKPSRIVVDDLDNVYVLAEGFYYGAVVYDAEGNYRNFFGASKVKVSAALIADMFWRQFMNDTQLDYTKNYLPAAFTSMDIDDDNFIYTVIAETSGAVKKLNFLGSDIFAPEGGPDPLDKSVYGDRSDLWLAGKKYTTVLTDIAVSSDDIVYVLDKTRGRVFEYDKDSNLLNVFGAAGTQEGTFKTPVAVESVGNDVLVLDQDKAQICVFTPTDYGALVHEATVLYHEGLFDAAYDKWQAVLSYNANSDLAYRGIGRAYLQQGKYEDAMYYAKLGQDRLGYSKAFRLYRSDVARQYFGYAVGVIAVILIAAFILKRNWKKIKAKLGIKDKKPKLYRVGHILFHPVDFYEKLHVDRTYDSLIKSVIVVGLFFLGNVMSNLATGFVFNKNNITEFNSFFMVAQSLGLVAIWVTSDMVVSSLRFGHGSVRTIFNGTAAALIPYTATFYINLILSQFLVYEEASIMSIITTIGMLYTIFLLYQSTRILQKYTVLEAMLSMVLNVLVALVIILLIIIVYMLVRQMAIFVSTIYQEIAFRVYY